MNFSALFRQSDHLCDFSPSGELLATASQYRLVIRDASTLQILQLYTCLDSIQYIEWSVDSMFVLCGMFKRGIVQVWSIEQPEWTCKIDEGSAGMTEVHWSPDGRHVLTTSEFHVRITIWSLVNKLVSYIKYPKKCQPGYDFSGDGKYMALAERRDCKDFVSIFTCASWQLVKHFDTETDDLAGIKWSPDGRVLGIWESLLQYKMLIYSLDGRCLATYSAYEHALGIKTVMWSPSSQFLAIGSYDERVRLLNHITWKTVTVKNHPATVESGNVVVYKETESMLVPQSLEEMSLATTTLFTKRTKYEIQSCPVEVPVVIPDPNKANPRLGVGLVEFSKNSCYMATRNDNMPCALWIWDIKQVALVVILMQSSSIRCMQWDPNCARLALCTGTNKLYMWSAEGTLCVEVPTEATFHVNSLKWHPSGNALLLLGKDQVCVCFISNEAATN